MLMNYYIKVIYFPASTQETYPSDIPTTPQLTSSVGKRTSGRSRWPPCECTAPSWLRGAPWGVEGAGAGACCGDLSAPPGLTVASSTLHCLSGSSAAPYLVFTFSSSHYPHLLSFTVLPTLRPIQTPLSCTTVSSSNNV